MAKRVFHPPDAVRRPTKDANSFMAKHLTLVSEQRNTYEGVFCHMYSALAGLTNVMSDNVSVNLKLFAMTDYNQRRLVRVKMTSIFKPSVRWAINLGASDSSKAVLVESSKSLNTWRRLRRSTLWLARISLKPRSLGG